MKKNAIKFEQPFGTFYAVSFKASELLKLAFSDSYRVEEDEAKGTQRDLKLSRTKEIKDYIKSTDCGFPNSIILAGNISQQGFVCDDESLVWTVSKDDDGNYFMIIPEMEKLASIIDGQHRLFGFSELTSSELEKRDMDLLCSVYLDLPSSLQAFLFATINSTQRPVSKVLAYDLFGYDLSTTEPKTWSPDKAAISIARKLGQDSVINGRINSTGSKTNESWGVSLSAVTDSILRLISSDPKKDKYFLHQKKEASRDRQSLYGYRKEDPSPLRELYVAGRDDIIYKVVSNFLESAVESYNMISGESSALTKTIGFQGLFDCLRKYLMFMVQEKGGLKNVPLKKESFNELFEKSKDVDFSSDFYLRTTGVGRTRVRQTILYAFCDKLEPKIKEADLKDIRSALKI
jgi:DNA phosphorothioation-associated DGQHR protein 1